MINLIIKDENYWITNKDRFSIQSIEKFVNYFLSFINFNSKTTKNVVVYGIQDTLQYSNNNNINILVSVENCYYWKHYKHFNLFGNYNDKKINIYIYNHINKLVRTENYIAIPCIYLQIDYFLNYYNKIEPTKYTPWNNKKDCLIVSNNKLHNNINRKLEIMMNIFKFDHIKNIKELKNKSCYHSNELLNVFNNYKFIICFENSLTDGYITEKLFNVFFSRAMPIYLGPNDKLRYFSKDSFIDLNENIEVILKKMNFLNTEDNYKRQIDTIKINSSFDNENYKLYANEFFNSLL